MRADRRLSQLLPRTTSDPTPNIRYDIPRAEDFTQSTLQVQWPQSAPFKICENEAIKTYYKQAAATVATDSASLPTSPQPRRSYVRALEHLFHFIECRNVILNVVSNISEMRRELYCQEKISLLVLDESRDQVARLLPVSVEEIKNLAIAFEEELYKILHQNFSTVLTMSYFNDSLEVTRQCTQLLSRLGLRRTVFFFSFEIWRSTVHTIDLAVLSYAGAHIQPFDSEYLHGTLDTISVLRPFIARDQIVVRRRSFLCLHQFFGGQKAWVFEKRSSMNSTPLYLSTDAQTFADIWGPMWMSCSKEDGKIFRYNVGGGGITPWSSVPSLDTKASEVFCHWALSAENVGDERDIEHGMRPTLRLNDILLIGASTKLSLNPTCASSLESIEKRLRDSGCLSVPDTRPRTRYCEGESVLVQVGWNGVGGGYQRSYKMREVRTWKQSLVERWKNAPAARNPRVLEDRHGVEVSMCTGNARRKRLITLLGSRTMTNFLKNLTWRGEKECLKNLLTALESEDHTAFSTLYKSHPEWQADLGETISLCLEALSKTGVNEEGNLSVFWVLDTGIEHSVELQSSTHTWAGFLKDSRETCTMAIFEDVCLELKDINTGKQCQSHPSRARVHGVSHRDPPCPGFSVLETLLIINENIIPEGLRTKPVPNLKSSTGVEEHRWSVRGVRKGLRLSFAEQGRLSVITPMHGGYLVVETEGKISAKLSETQNKLHGLVRRQDFHQEYIQDQKLAIMPIPLLIMSTSAQVTRVTNAPRVRPVKSSIIGSPIKGVPMFEIPLADSLSSSNLALRPSNRVRVESSQSLLESGSSNGDSDPESSRAFASKWPQGKGIEGVAVEIEKMSVERRRMRRERERERF
jgi:hypothetical protein